MDGSYTLRYFCAHFQLVLLRKDDVNMMNMLFYKTKLNLEEIKLEYERLWHGAEY